MDARLGGGYRVTFGPEPAGDLYLEEGTYSIFEPVERLAWDGLLSGEGASERSSIAIRFTADGDGTVLDITESGSRRNRLPTTRWAGTALSTGSKHCSRPDPWAPSGCPEKITTECHPVRWALGRGLVSAGPPRLTDPRVQADRCRRN
jgi:hypothetical protein